MTNILEAIVNIANNPVVAIRNHYTGRNRANNVGEALEMFVKDAFANTIQEQDEQIKNTRYNQVFSWLGNQNNPPDIMIKQGDALEVKKTQGANTKLALNSSFPKSSINSNSNMILPACRNCENWTEKDIIYCVGHTSDTSIKTLWLVYGSIYAAKPETYQIIQKKIKKGINEIPNIEFAETNELGGVKKVDPLGITNLRIRGMWQIQNPRKVFNYLHTAGDTFELVAIIPTNKYNSFPNESKNRIENLQNKNLSIADVKVKDPNHPANLIDAKLIIFKTKI
jgi:NgoPII restriction endonuclease